MRGPTPGRSPMPPLLANARALGERLAAADERFAMIVGAGQETVTRATRAARTSSSTRSRGMAMARCRSHARSCRARARTTPRWRTASWRGMRSSRRPSRMCCAPGETRRLQTKCSRDQQGGSAHQRSRAAAHAHREGGLGAHGARRAPHFPADAQRAAAPELRVPVAARAKAKRTPARKSAPSAKPSPPKSDVTVTRLVPPGPAPAGQPCACMPPRSAAAR